MNLIELNERLNKNGYESVYPMSEFNALTVNIKALSLLDKVANGNFNVNHEYFEFDGYDNLVSYESLEDVLELYDDID